MFGATVLRCVAIVLLQLLIVAQSSGQTNSANTDQNFKFNSLIDIMAGADVDKSRKARAALLKAGKDAFPALLKRINDRRLMVHPAALESRVRLAEDGKTYVPHQTQSVGRAAFLILRQQIEGLHHKSYEYAFEQNQAKNWIKERKRLSLDGMRLDAARTTLKIVIDHAASREMIDVYDEAELRYVLKRIEALAERPMHSSKQTDAQPQ